MDAGGEPTGRTGSCLCAVLHSMLPIVGSIPSMQAVCRPMRKFAVCKPSWLSNYMRKYPCRCRFDSGGLRGYPAGLPHTGKPANGHAVCVLGRGLPAKRLLGCSWRPVPSHALDLLSFCCWICIAAGQLRGAGAGGGAAAGRQPGAGGGSGGALPALLHHRWSVAAGGLPALLAFSCSAALRPAATPSSSQLGCPIGIPIFMSAGAMTKSNVESLSALLASLQQQQQQAGGARAAGAAGAAATPGAAAGGSSGGGDSDSLSPVLE